MKSDATMLSEVVVYTGYMTQKKADLTGSVAMANASDLKKNASANAMKSLQGKMAGVHITTMVVILLKELRCRFVDCLLFREELSL